MSHSPKISKDTQKGKKKVAVVFGGRSPEHDVSTVTGLQVLSAIDNERFEAFPLYISPEGTWYVGDVLRKRENYLLSGETLKAAQEVTLDVCVCYDEKSRKGRLLPKKRGLLKRAKPIEFDVALLCFHGLFGEDGNLQGLMEIANIPYTGMRTMASSILMDKVATKYVLQSNNIPTLPFAAIKRPDEGYKVPMDELKKLTKHISFPACLKPAHLGSSIGVARIEKLEDIQPCLPAIFQYDDTAILEPFVENLVEYNVAVTRMRGDVEFSALEKPKAVDELLDFKQKYLSGSDDKSGNKTGTKTADTGAAISEGMLSLTRELNPKLTKKMEKQIKDYAATMFEAVSGTGAPRIDFIGNAKTGEIWMNEVNPIPGSFGYFLWEATEDQILFSDLLSALIDEALTIGRQKSMPKDPVPKDARLLTR